MENSAHESRRPQDAQRRHELRRLAAAQGRLPRHHLERPHDFPLEAPRKERVVLAVRQLVHPRQNDVQKALLLQEHDQDGDDLSSRGGAQLGEDGAGAAEEAD